VRGKTGACIVCTELDRIPIPKFATAEAVSGYGPTWKYEAERIDGMIWLNVARQDQISFGQRILSLLTVLVCPPHNNKEIILNLQHRIPPYYFIACFRILFEMYSIFHYSGNLKGG